MSNILEENKNLSSELNELLSSRETSILRKQDDMVDNLRQQISSLLLEKEQVTTLWQESVASLGEFRGVQSCTEFVPKIDSEQMKNYEQKIEELETRLQIVQKQLEDEQQRTRTEAHDKKRAANIETESEAMQIIKNLEEEILTLQNRLLQMEKSKVQVEKSLKSKDQYIQKILMKNKESEDKVREAVQIVEAALLEKDAALFREKETREQIQKINQDIDDIVRDTENKIRIEVATVTVACDKKCQELGDTLRTAQEELKMKSLEIEKYQTKCELFESELDKFRKGNYDFSDSNASKLLILEKNLESTFQKLLLSEKHNIQLSSEKETVKRDMEQLAEHYERTLKAKEIEILTLDSKIKMLETRLDEAQLGRSGLEKKLQQVAEERVKFEEELKTERDERNRQEKSSSERIKELTRDYDGKINELELKLKSRDEIHNKWVTETKCIIDNLEKLVISLKREVHVLRKENKRLENELKNYKEKYGKCKEYLQIISRDVNNVTCISMDRKNEILNENLVNR
ncbi:unnamed protein product [Callosobruchus maculatus]|nr:unnamed protein product [Callosobruchus maculatus]